ncbi:hypothetical protein B0T20DRAFT_141828 [Sordaria brevicollis]|uniref:Uncharacterized protein n=1 Tax=Sordaria brevicollis TaxID=83679 RepID=A0AAE0U0D9_SORBR|nr:hypothetical protein B0T20DRAFT_141828 [Sordaria brevicollis]
MRRYRQSAHHIVDEAQFWRHQEEQRRQAEQERQQRQQLQQREQERVHQRQRLEELAQQLGGQAEEQAQQQAQQQAYPIQEYSSSNTHHEPDAKYPTTNQQDYYPDLEAQRPTVASSSGQVQTDPRNRRGHGCQHEDGKQRPGNCCMACFGGCLAGCAACCYCCVVM